MDDKLRKFAKAMEERFKGWAWEVSDGVMDISAIMDDSPYGRFAALNFSLEWDDLDNSSFIIWAWDRLEDLDLAPVITAKWIDGSGCKISLGDGRFVEAKTRAEALFNALLSALENAAEATGNQPPPTN